MFQSRCVGQLACKSAHGVRAFLRKRVRSTCAGVGSLQTGDSRSRISDQIRVPWQIQGREELNHERPNFKKGLPVSVLGDAAENAVWESILARTAVKSGDRRVRGSFCVLTPEIAKFGVPPTG
jgi:hypothetical protein